MYLDNPDPEYQVKLKPSQALRIGAAFRPKCKGSVYFNGTSCALGAMLEGYGFKLYPMGTDEAANRIVNFHPNIPYGLLMKVTSYNDNDGWSRERIANWLEKQGY